jgi:hypothetical protein
MQSYPLTSARRPSFSIARAVVAGFIALGVSTILLVTVSGLAGSLGEVYRDRGTLFEWMYQLTHNSVVELGRDRLFAALAIHLSFGMLWAVIYALFFEPRLRANPGWQAGALFSLLPFFLSVVVFLPLTGAGFFGSNLGAGPLPLLGNLVLHLIYGAVLGAGYSASAEQTELAADASAEAVVHSQTMTRAESNAAVGIFVGVVVGAIAGILFGYVLPPSQIEKMIGSWPIAMGVAGALAGAAIGALLGSMSGLTDPYATPAVAAGQGQPVAAALVPLAAIITVAALIISIGSLLLTVGDTHHFGRREGYDQAIVTGLALLAVVSLGATALDRWWAGRPGHEH